MAIVWSDNSSDTESVWAANNFVTNSTYKVDDGIR
jgi:hypothetical protein